MREVAAMGQVHAENGVAGLKDGRIGGFIGLRTGVGLHVGVFGFEELPGAIAGQVLHDVGVLTPAVITLTRVAFGVFVGKYAGCGFEDCFGSEVLTGNQLNPGVLPVHFFLDRIVNLWIHFGQGPGHALLVGSAHLI